MIAGAARGLNKLRMIRAAYLLLGLVALLLGAAGAVLPLLPTVPFLILAAFCFARSSPALERRLLSHPLIGPQIVAWRTRGAISRRGKRAALVAFAVSAGMGFALLSWPWPLLPLAAAVVGGVWIWRRPD
jgi:uncharacterized protein